MAARKLSPVVRQLLGVLVDGPIEDPSGRTVAKLLPLTGYTKKDALTTAVYRLQANGLITRETRATRTYRISITDKGRKAYGQKRKNASTVAAVVDGVAVLPAGRASGWDVIPLVDDTTAQMVSPLVEASAEAADVPAVESTSEVGGEIDYDVLAAAMIRTCAKAKGVSDETEALRKLLAQDQAARPAAEAAANAVEGELAVASEKVAELEAELTDVKGRLFHADTELRVTKQNVETLTKRIEIAERRLANGRSIDERLPAHHKQDLDAFGREIAKLMVEKPTARG
jgi:DNA-binding MarR family transcriptional regulator